MNTPILTVLCSFLVAVIVGVVLVQKSGSRLAQVVLAALLLLPAAFCVFGFIATFEPMDPVKQMSFRIGYVVLGFCLTLTSVLLLIRGPLPTDQSNDGTTQARNPVSTALLFIGVISLAIGLMPNGKKYTDSEAGERVTHWRIGLEFSPIYHRIKRESDNGLRKYESSLQLISWSLLPIAIGAICFEIRRRRIISEPEDEAE